MNKNDFKNYLKLFEKYKVSPLVSCVLSYLFLPNYD